MNCLGKNSTSGCTQYTGKDYGSLGIVRGSDLDKVIESLISHITDRGDSKEAVLASQVVYDGSNPLEYNISECALALAPAPFEQSWLQSSQGHRYVYDLGPSLHRLPPNYYVTERQITITGRKGESLVSSSPSGVLLYEGSLPVLVEVNIRMSSPCGELLLHSRSQLDQDVPTPARAVLQVEDRMTSPVSARLTIKELLGQLASQVRRNELLDDRVRALESAILSIRTQMEQGR